MLRVRLATRLCARNRVQLEMIGIPEDWTPYYEKKRFLGLIPFDRPRGNMQQEHLCFLQMASQVAWRVVAEDNSGISLFLPIYIGRKTIGESVGVCRSLGYVYKDDAAGIVVLKPSSGNQLADIVASDLFKGLRAVEAVAGQWSLEGALLFSKNAIKRARWSVIGEGFWFRRYLGAEVSACMLFHRERPYFRVERIDGDNVALNEAARAAAQHYGLAQV